MATPLVISFWMRAAVTLVDTVYASFVGDAAIAAVGLTVPLEFLMIAAWVGVSSGLTSVLSRAMGARAHRKVEQYLEIGWKLVWIVSPVFTLIGGAVWIVAPRLGLDEAVARSFQVYGTVLIGGSAITTFWSILPDSVVKAHQDTRSTMWAGIWSNVINLGLNTLFLFGFGWGLFGIAFSTVLGRIGGLVYAIVLARRHERRRRAEQTGRVLDLDPAPYRAVLRLAVPSSLTFALMATESGLFNALLAGSRHATEAIAAYSIYYRAQMFALQPIIAVAVAMLPYAAHRLGAGDGAGVRNGLRSAGLAAALYSVALVGPVMLLAGPWLATQLSESPITAAYSRLALLVVPLFCLANVPFLLYRPVFEALQRGRPGLVMAAVRYVVLTAPLAGLGIWIAQRQGAPSLYGLLAGALAAAILSSALFHVWLRSALATLPRESGPATEPG